MTQTAPVGIRGYLIKSAAYKQAAIDVHLGRCHWQSDGDIVSAVAEEVGPLTPSETERVVEAYDEILRIHEIERS